MTNPHDLASDNHAGIHPALLSAIADANHGHALAYGEDKQTQEAEEKLKELFGPQTQSFFVFNGTAANTLALTHMCKSYQAVLTTSISHINTNECGAPENFGGFKLITVDTPNGKLTPELLKKSFDRQNNPHHNHIKVLSLTQITELGTCYTKDELIALVKIAKQQNCYVYIDGARLSNAAAHLQIPIAEWTTDIGIDMLNFGGTKNGMLFGEAVVILNPELQVDFEFVRKQGMQLASKHRFIAAQYNAILTNDLWLNIGKHSNAMASLLAKYLLQIDEITLLHPVQGNMLFVKFPENIIQPLQQYCFFHSLNGTARLVTSYDTTENDIIGFIKKIKECLLIS